MALQVAHSAGNTRLDRIMTREMIGVQRSYFEKFTGTAKYANGDYRGYDLNGCEVWIKESKDKSITSISLQNLSSKCTFDASNIFLNGPAHKLTFGDLVEGTYFFSAMETCIDGCGNIRNPTYGVNVWGPGAIGELQFQGEYIWSPIEADRNLANRAVENFLNTMKRILKTDTWVDYEDAVKKLGLKKYTKIFISDFNKVKITSITFGYNILRDSDYTMIDKN
jgi:hypothetical protein